MFDRRIAEVLMAKGWEFFRSPRQLVAFTGNHEADLVLNDLDRTPHAYVIACVMDRQVKAELAWLVPYRLSSRLGGFEFERLRPLSLEDVTRLMGEPEPLHRFPVIMAAHLHAAIRTIQREYEGNAARIWDNRPPSALVVYRFLQFQGVGPKIATMAANILARDLKVPMADYYSIDVSVDVHVRRVFSRLGLVPPDAPAEEFVYAARAISAEFPGLLDLPCWQIGRQWCRPQSPNCDECYMNPVCPCSKIGSG